VFAIFESDSTRSRYKSSINEKKYSGREDIYPAAWQMFLEKPFVGWGPNDNKYEVGRRAPIQRVSHPEGDRDTHNMFLEVLTAEGLPGAIPLFTFVVLCVIAGWGARRGAHGLLPLALAVTVIVINMSGNWLASKLDWLMMAYVLASASPLRAARLRLPVRLTSLSPRMRRLRPVRAQSKPSSAPG
jgi:O-antigen ligase